MTNGKGALYPRVLPFIVWCFSFNLAQIRSVALKHRPSPAVNLSSASFTLPATVTTSLFYVA